GTSGPEQPTERALYRQLTWQPADHNPDRFNWAEVPGEHRRKRRSVVQLEQKIGVLNAPRAPLDDFQRRWHGVQAIAYLHADRQVHVGLADDNDSTPLFWLDPTDNSRYALGVRAGGNSVQAV